MVNILIEKYISEIIIGLIIINLLLAIYVITQNIHNRKIFNKYKKLMKNAAGKSLEDQLINIIQVVDKNLLALNNMEESVKKIKKQIKNSIQKVGIVRYNAFSDMGSDLSYAVALLNEQGNGIVMSSIYSRDDFRAFAKPVTMGKSSYRLSEEEEEAIKMAFNS